MHNPTTKQESIAVIISATILLFIAPCMFVNNLLVKIISILATVAAVVVFLFVRYITLPDDANRIQRIGYMAGTTTVCLGYLVKTIGKGTNNPIAEHLGMVILYVSIAINLSSMFKVWIFKENNGSDSSGKDEHE